MSMEGILANIYMHNVLTLWYKFIITKECKGDNFLIVYADDFVAGFQYKWEAENYYKLLKERMEKFGLQLEESKSRLLQSGAYIARAKQKSGESTRLETFDWHCQRYMAYNYEINLYIIWKYVKMKEVKLKGE